MEKILYIILFLCVFWFMITLKNILYEKESIIKVIGNFENRYKKRLEDEAQRKVYEGNVIKNSFFYKVDIMIERSRIRERYPLLNSELYITITLVSSFIGFLISRVFISYWGFNFIIAITIIFIFYLIIYYLSGINFELIDDNIMTFINNIENFSVVSNDIITIIEEVIPYTEEPLKYYLIEFISKSRNTGDTEAAFKMLEDKIENKKFNSLLKNLEIASRLNANYSEIIKETRTILDGYFEGKTKRKILISNGRTGILILLVAAFIILWAINGFIKGLIGYLTTSLLGNILVFLGILIFVYSLWNFVSLDRE